MLPSRGLARHPASALRYSLSSRTKPTPTLSTRQFSQAQSQSSVLSRHGRSRANVCQHGKITPSTSAVGYGASVGIPSGVFAQRSGAARNLSLWPFQSKPQTPQTPETAETPSEWSSASSASPSASAPAQAHPPVYETSTPAEPLTNAAESSASQVDPTQLPDDLLRAFDSQSFLDIPERIGYLAELGLDYGRGPTSCCQWLIEHIHVYTGLPWWGTIAAVALLFRGVMFYPTLMGSKNSAKVQLAHSTPEYKKADADFKEATFRTGDRAAQLYARGEMRRLNREAGVSGLAMLTPFASFAMIPFSYGMFRLLRGMADVPVPGMDTGGLVWFTDLTICDPLYILPCISTGMAVLMFKQMQRANMKPNPMQETMMNGMTYILPPMMFLGTAWLPAGIQWFFFVLSIGSIAQTQTILHPSVRRSMGLPRLDAPKPRVLEYQSPSKRGLRGSLEDGINAASQSVKQVTGATEDKARWKSAKDYEERRAEEERQNAERRLNEARRRRAGR